MIATRATIRLMSHGRAKAIETLSFVMNQRRGEVLPP